MMRLKEKKTLSRIILVALGSCLITGCNTKSSVKQLPEREIVEQVDDNSEETIGSVLDVVGFKVYDAIEGFRESMMLFLKITVTKQSIPFLLMFNI